ncbi:ctr copper transporter [Colletotrichum paranaense]|uniref:Copper transport protein n=1 Tax=Colletotrichum paranaense TaxID=1914294 RepID=A0ABQ9T0X1_9PEZI|nr:ctr copper transporter [Colletotrichum paranaense]KAK1545418.1 ctr copper transporter [Colletotrichum paranaense]
MDHAHMDHSKMDHSAMDHGDMGGHGMGGGMGDRCSMNMLFTWDTKNLCIVFRQWHVRSTSGLVISLLLVVALAAGYEALRAASRRYENSVNKRVDSLPTKKSSVFRGVAGTVTETTPFLWTGREQAEASRSAHLVKAVLYAAQNFYAFMLMLVFMTYNGWVMVAVAIGAFVGYAAFGSSTSSTKDNACH